MTQPDNTGQPMVSLPRKMNDYDKEVQLNYELYGLSGVYQLYPCGCMGPIKGEPLCPCAMRKEAGDRFMERLLNASK
jgi:hypothetical protein